MTSEQWSWLVPEGLWEIVQPLLPPPRARPQGGGTANIDDRAVFAAIVFVLTSGCAWRHLPPCFGASKSTVHRRFTLWSRAGVGATASGAAGPTRRRGAAGPVTRHPRLRARTGEKGGGHTGPSPVDRGKPGSKMHVLSDAAGLPIGVGISGGNVHDLHGLRPMVEGFQMKHDPQRGRCRLVDKLYADKAYDRPDLRRWLRSVGITPRIARIGVESSQRLGRRRWLIERTISWLTGYRRLSPRYERNPRNYLAFLGLAAALTCYKRLLTLTT
ncbi:IS5 family transposase [Actinomadura formosensis]|uniref:IS5 family transposase n=1 Tax=Actinomadura formosensis TaxID=60706 RepID=UPI001F5F0888|nr:IS5 family transposase [Actinomadura formosensis]